MAYAHFERLSALDLSFLAMEDGRAHMHIGSVSIFDALPLRGKEGGLDFERLLAFVEAQLHKVPRLRQKLAFVPGLGQPVWVDDERFNVNFHVRHTALPPPGDLRQLKRLAGRILSQEFDRGKPLWEDWFVDGLEGDRFALISKVHHCMADGLSGVAMAKLLVGIDPDYVPATPKKWIPRPAPSGSRLLVEELRHRAGAPFALLRGGGSESDARSAGSKESPSALRGLVDTFSNLASGASPTPLNVEIGPHRRFDWTRMPLEKVRALGSGAGATVNDVVLAIASSALRKFLRRRGVGVESLEFRAVVPVSVRTGAESDSLGNRVSGMVTKLPLDEADPWKRLLRVVDTTHELKRSGQAAAGETLGHVIDLLPPPLLGPLFRRAARSSAANMVITNVPGPRVPVYLLGARQLETYPVVPLINNQALGIALMSYADGLSWGLNADWDALPDLHDLVLDIDAGFEELAALSPSVARVGRERTGSPVTTPPASPLAPSSARAEPGA